MCFDVEGYMCPATLRSAWFGSFGADVHCCEQHMNEIDGLDELDELDDLNDLSRRPWPDRLMRLVMMENMSLDD
jgi:hypothetical protein